MKKYIFLDFLKYGTFLETFIVFRNKNNCLITVFSSTDTDSKRFSDSVKNEPTAYRKIV